MVNTLQNMFDSSLFGSCQFSFPKLKNKTRKRRHVPHSQRSPEYVLHRNTRERKRVEAMNDAFQLLRKHVPFIGETSDRASKVGILYGAARYIRVLADILDETSPTTSFRSDVNENILTERQDLCGWYENSLNNTLHVPGNQEDFNFRQSQLQTSETCMFMEIQQCPPRGYTHCLENVRPHQQISECLPNDKDCQTLCTPNGLLW